MKLIMVSISFICERTGLMVFHDHPLYDFCFLQCDWKGKALWRSAAALQGEQLVDVFDAA